MTFCFPLFFKLPLTSKKEPLMNPSVAQAKPYPKNVAFWFFGMPKTSGIRPVTSFKMAWRHIQILLRKYSPENEYWNVSI